MLKSPSRMLNARHGVVEFTGREADSAALDQWRDSRPRLAARWLYGPGGQGKTRLAARFAARSTERGWAVVTATHGPGGVLPPPGSQDLRLHGNSCSESWTLWQLDPLPATSPRVGEVHSFLPCPGQSFLSEVMQELGASSRFEAGVRAAKLGRLDCPRNRHPFRSVYARRPCSFDHGEPWSFLGESSRCPNRWDTPSSPTRWTT
ncbi:ATP-binding protein [Kitasatospora sp. NPDC057542]|uniref:ATP-binding protein n=1 Tax=Streptomycetaceae TaxID=2062 RepID=UPI001CCD2DBB|nr:ATP-binding protein [Streptomyces sp. LS1784]